MWIQWMSIYVIEEHVSLQVKKETHSTMLERSQHPCGIYNIYIHIRNIYLHLMRACQNRNADYNRPTERARA